ncbi:DUF1223 domain-containing protein [Pedobacter sp. KBW06]|uniref:DUF1223 domain-containing protein n=1 Tax=Pedobacter sp. KBW06 TaxID=2153359 RepID=UPI000F5A81BA|nr:DUF1223 domain-containing protein [Pedobacter sp. KBW06]RQO71784.1 DUF1223 domain-containing protein [Pedobacter sp. KBW06]
MKHLWLLTSLITWAVVNGGPEKAAQKRMVSDTGFAVVELFTSEGCSSCPAAEKLLKEVHQEYQGRPVYVLAFHVDYWNKLGWTDKFSSAEFTRRQYQYSAFFMGQIYTPQAIVNGRESFVGSDGEKIHGAINTALKRKVKLQQTQYKIGIKDRHLLLDYTLDQTYQGNLISVALLQGQESVQIAAGENKGKLLEHLNVVRSFYSAPALDPSGSISLDIPEGLDPKGLHLLVYLQNQKNFNVISVSELSL